MSKGIYIRTEEQRKHMSEAHKGNHYPKISEAKKGKHYPKVSEAKKGKHTSPNTEFKKGDNVGEKNPMYGKHLSEEARQKISKAHWKGGSIMSHRRAKDKRRGFDFVPLNNSFDGAEAHHIDKTYIIYMDKKDHESIYHSVLKNINMDEINALAWNYL